MLDKQELLGLVSTCRRCLKTRSDRLVDCMHVTTEMEDAVRCLVARTDQYIEESKLWFITAASQQMSVNWLLFGSMSFRGRHAAKNQGQMQQ